MAKFSATLDDDSNEITIATADKFKISKQIGDVLTDWNGPYYGTWAQDYRSLRFEADRGREAVNWLESHGHTVRKLRKGERINRDSVDCPCGGNCAANAVPPPANLRELVNLNRVGKVID